MFALVIGEAQTECAKKNLYFHPKQQAYIKCKLLENISFVTPLFIH